MELDRELGLDEVRLRLEYGMLQSSAAPQRCGAALPPESVFITSHGPARLSLFARAKYRGMAGERHLFSYVIEVHNLGPVSVQLITRYWLVMDADGVALETMGVGIAGAMPTISAGDRFSFTMEQYVRAWPAALSGSLTFDVVAAEEGGSVPLPPGQRRFSAAVARLSLSESGGEELVPCGSSANEIGQIPTASVAAFPEGVLLGVMVEAQAQFTEEETMNYGFIYEIQIANRREEPVQLMRRRIEILDARGHVFVDEGEGPTNEHTQPAVLQPGRVVRIAARFAMPTEIGNLSGEFELMVGSGEGAQRFKVQLTRCAISRYDLPVARITPSPLSTERMTS